MVSLSSNLESPISGMKLSSVVPAKDTGNKDHQFTDLDLAMKLHNVKGVYLFDSDAVRGLTIHDLKKPMFELLEIYFTAAGRIRRSETTGRPFLKCNDGGVRIVEAFCDTSIDEWLESNDDSRDNSLAYYQTLGPDLRFSPLVFVQFTWFKCGGVSLGLSWAHVLGDPVSASTFVNKWAQIVARHVPSKSLHLPKPRKSEAPTSVPGKLSPMKRIEPVGDHWTISNNCSMETHYFKVTAKQLDHMVSKVCAPTNVSHFEVLSAIIWKSLEKLREDSGPRVVTICRYNYGNRENEIPTNDLVLSTVEADFNVRKGDISELAVLIADKKKVDGNSLAEEILSEKDGESSDFIVYGANLTFVNMEEADVYGLKLQGKKPVSVNYAIDGVGDEGVVMILPGPEEDEDGCGRKVTVVLPGDQLALLKKELNNEWALV
ncbi:hypothetical protein Patl1_08668 [Pistacia atlantica]|uniref:Uncharacterized protein n=1 Tax=Pistacia atlantica TaxID=434234 RepID=A0ACC1AGG9_9ROSI|nr:hypothetical protein Patl1_08668 [Pistacia atlantica]